MPAAMNATDPTPKTLLDSAVFDDMPGAYRERAALEIVGFAPEWDACCVPKAAALAALHGA
jgi:hypothetical protein